jgi:hypothetical protein
MCCSVDSYAAYHRPRHSLAPLWIAGVCWETLHTLSHAPASTKMVQQQFTSGGALQAHCVALPHAGLHAVSTRLSKHLAVLCCTVKGPARLMSFQLTPCCSAEAGRVFTARGLLGKACGSAAAGSIRASAVICRRAPALQHCQEQNVHQASSRSMSRAVQVDLKNNGGYVASCCA